ncbi:esterase family protein [Nocardia panacis]|uniref:Esterase family protein n=1 Tax=Nocardia panacis TaxID=2340916 RepID=A0A3A4KLA0_9NOCA|nr:alpha/beta hydrolase family protein [Nocardia panacis]RJO76328.1 esterase family protein [Nocardia panacis]
MGVQPRTWARIALASVLAALSIGTGVDSAAADPNPVPTTVKSPDGSYVAKVEVKDQRNWRIYIGSAAMDAFIPVDVLRPADTSVPRPTLYLLNGAGGGEDDATWQRNTDAMQFLSDKDVNVVQPIGGQWSFYTDWQRDDPVLGPNKWKTYIAEELPPLIDAQLGANGVNSMAGLSMSGTSVLNFAIDYPGKWRSVAVYSGIAQVSDPIGQRMVKLTVETWGGGDTRNMWGPNDSPLWRANDPLLQAEKLRGTNLFISTGTGIPGAYDIPGNKFRMEDPEDTPTTVVVGAVIEAGVNWSTHNMQQRLNELNIPATFVYRDTGTHSWGYWQDDLHTSWPVLAQGLYSAP